MTGQPRADACLVHQQTQTQEYRLRTPLFSGQKMVSAPKGAVGWWDVWKRKSQPISRVLSWTAIHLGRGSLLASSSLPGSRADRTCGSLRLLPYLALLRVGFSVPRTVTRRAVRSYRTFSPLPALARLGGMFSVALSMGSRPPGVTWHPVLWSPDFPQCSRTATVWPTPGSMILERAISYRPAL